MKTYRTQNIYTPTDLKGDSPSGVFPMRFPDGCFGMQLVFLSKKKAREFDAKCTLEEVELKNLE